MQRASVTFASRGGSFRPRGNPGCLRPDRLPAPIPLLVDVRVPEHAGVALVGEPDLDARLVADRGSIPIETDSNVGCGLEHLVDKVTRRDASDVILLRYGLAARGNELVVVAVEGGGQLNLRCHQGSQAFMFSFANQIGRSPVDWHDLSPQPLIVGNPYQGGTAPHSTLCHLSGWRIDNKHRSSTAAGS